MSLIEGLAAHLAGAGIGTYRSNGTAYTADETAICLEYQPEQPDVTITLTTYPGLVPDSKLGMDSPRIQVRCRAATRGAASDLAAAVYAEMEGLSRITLPDGTRLLLCAAQTTPYYLGRDDSSRDQYVTNYQCDVVNVSTHRV